MSNIIKINFRKRKRLTSLLGLTLDGSRLEGVVLRRTNGSLQLLQSFSATLTLDPLTAAPELVAREIRNQLDAAGVRERNCMVGLPLRWVLTGQTELPQLPEADAESLLQIEAEKSFSSDVATLRMADSRCALPAGKQFVTLVGISNSQLTTLEQVLTAAKLKPAGFSLGLSALQAPGVENSDGVLALAVGESHVGLQITAGGGIAALRALEGAIEIEGARRSLHAGLVAREARVTLGQLPTELRATVNRIRIFGPRDLAQPLADEMELRFAPMGMRVEVVSAYAPGEFGVQLPLQASLSAAFSLAARCLMDQAAPFEFLLPKPTLLQQFATKYSSGKLKTVGAIAAGVLLIVGGLFMFQQVELILLRSQWSKMSAKVTELQGLQQNIQQFKPWFDNSFTSLSVMRQLTLAFPENGAVTAKTVEIHDGNVVTCTGTAQSQAALLKTIKQLSAEDGVSKVTLGPIRGKAPTMQFTFDFHFNNGGQL
jgi:Tfp pilus assembly protein PilN